ncbi:hypothetical protein T07_5793 [Trichinella nelsoni]|uniref:Uncharacterized protein n=1 Tax=Trichinella nelsoni TaxID=6336 RepID=A0A0V0SKD5_9BILA|nr:hypothetical protein T07_5793 [Trichinella nelsoni]
MSNGIRQLQCPQLMCQHWRDEFSSLFVIATVFLHVRAAPRLHVAAHSGPIESASHSCQCRTLSQVICARTVVHGLHDFISEGSGHQILQNPFLSHESAAISPVEAILLQPTAPLLPQHVHVAATLRGHSTGQFALHNHCRSSRISGSACWAASNCSLKTWVTSSGA